MEMSRPVKMLIKQIKNMEMEYDLKPIKKIERI